MMSRSCADPVLAQSLSSLGDAGMVAVPAFAYAPVRKFCMGCCIEVLATAGQPGAGKRTVTRALLF